MPRWKYTGYGYAEEIPRRVDCRRSRARRGDRGVTDSSVARGERARGCRADISRPGHPAGSFAVPAAPRCCVCGRAAPSCPPNDNSVPAVEEARPALCHGCLTERAVLDVVETYLRHLDPVYLHGEIWAHPLADIAPETPGHVDGQPKLPPGLLDAPEFNPMGKSIDTRRYPVETTWIVWVQTGWRSQQAIENQIVLGKLPEVALSWPPIKEETFVAVDGRTGEMSPDGIFRLTSQGLWPRHPPHYDAVLEATRARAARWLRGGGQQLGSP